MFKVSENKISRFSGTYRFLSNFYPASVEFEGVLYPTSEHAYQAAKTLDDTQRKKILKVKTPGQAKRLGRTVTLRPDWDLIKVEIMKQILTDKFQRHPDLRKQLLDTDDAWLAEANTWGDTTWGTVRGVGKNLLGKLLMELRERLKSCDN